MTRAEIVNSIFRDCLYRDDEIVNGEPVVPPIDAQLLTMRVGFHPQRLEQHRGRVIALAREVFQDPFLTSHVDGGGYSFLQIVVDREGNHWCEHRTAQELMGLCLGLGLATYPIPRDMWPALPGEVPYLTVHSDKLSEKEGEEP